MSVNGKPTAPDPATADEETVERQIGEMSAEQKNVRARLKALDADGLETREMLSTISANVTSLEKSLHALFDLVAETNPSPTPAGERVAPAAGQDDGGGGADQAANAAEEDNGGEVKDKSDPGGDDDEEAEDATTESEGKSDPGGEGVKEAEGTTTPEDEGAAEKGEEDRQHQGAPEGASDTATDGEAGVDAAPETTDPPPSPTEEEPATPARTAPSKREKKILRRLTTIERRLKRQPAPEPILQDVIAALGAIRTALDEQQEAITTAVALTPGDQTSADPRMPPAWQAWQEVMTRLDGMARMIRPVPVEPAASPSATETPALPPPTTTHPNAPVPVDTTDVSPPGTGEVLAPAALDEILAGVAAVHDAAARPRHAFARFAWVSILVVFLAAGALGVIAQQQYTLLDLPDATHGWKERVWEIAGEEIARCLAASSTGTCDVTVLEGAGTTTTP